MGKNITFSQTYCKFDTENGDRRIKILSNQKIDNFELGYDFVVYGVTQPETLDTYSKIYLALE